MYKLYGIPNCDTVKKARTFLDSKNVSVTFVDFKKTPPTQVDIKRWQKAFGDLPVNTKGATYKKLEEEYESCNLTQKIDFLIKNTSMIKRPILEKEGEVLAFGFGPGPLSKNLFLTRSCMDNLNSDLFIAVMDLQEAKKHQIRLKERGVSLSFKTNGATCTTGCKVTVEVWADSKDSPVIQEYFRADYLNNVKGHEPNFGHLAEVFDPSNSIVTCQACGMKFSPTLSECPDCGLVYL